MRRELLLIGEMIEAAEQAQALVSGADLDALTSDRQRRDALLWNFTVLGEAAAQLDAGVKERFPEIPWAQPARLRNRIVHGYWSIAIGAVSDTRRAGEPAVRAAGPACSPCWPPPAPARPPPATTLARSVSAA